MRNAARFFKALSDESRLKMLWLLLNHRELCVCDIMAVLEITQSKASRHLAALRHIGIATDRREGLWAYYSLRPAEDDLVKEHLKLLRKTLAKQPDARPLLEKLDSWLKAKGRGETCISTNGKVTVKDKARKGSNKASLTGVSR
jgi:ArsR family transcriptional regulator, arsenate/arsenite/antimonite-responsive transcriptional repressor